MVSLAMIAGALGTLLSVGGLPPWRVYGASAALLALLVLNLLIVGHEHLKSYLSLRVRLAFALESAALFLIAFQLGVTDSFSLIPFLLFLLVSQAIWGLPLRLALVYTAALLLACLFLSWYSDGPEAAVANGLSWLAGILFTVMFSLLARGYRSQASRTQELLVQLTRANAELAAAREHEKHLAVAQERVRLARDIHDGLGHHLTALHVQLQAAERLIAREPDRVAGILATCRIETQAALAEVRRSVAAMRGGPLEDRTLEAALADLARGFACCDGAVARFSQQGQPRDLPAPVAVTLYRAAQEGLTNAQKHTDACTVLLELRYTPDTVWLRVENDGSSAPHAHNDGFGLIGLRERAVQLGGTFRASPLPQGGFALDVELPCS